MQSLFESIDKLDGWSFLLIIGLFWLVWWILFRTIDRRKADKWSTAEIKKLATMKREPLKINKIK